MSELTASLKAFEASLSTDEQTELSAMERSAMVAETRDLLNKSQQNKGGVMGIQSRQAQVMPPAQGVPVAGPPKEGQGAPMPLAPAGVPIPGKEGQGAPLPPPAPAQAPVAPQAIDAQATGIDSYIDEKEDDANDPLSNGEMGISDPGKVAKVAAYVAAYGHLRIRPTAQNALEIFDPTKNATLMLVRPNKGTRKDAGQLRKCAVDVLASIAHVGLVKTAQLWKAQIKRADGGIVDYGTAAMSVKPKFSDNSINDRGETNMQQDVTLGVESTTGEGDNLTAKEQPETRQPGGLSGKAAAAKVPEKGGILPGHETNMADPPAKVSDGNSLSALDDNDDNLEDSLTKKNKGTDSMLDDAIDTMAGKSVTARRRAQAQPMGAPGAMPQTAQGAPAPGTGAPAPMPQMAQGMPDMEDPSLEDPNLDPAMAPGMGADTMPQAAQGEPGVDPNMDPAAMSVEQKFAHLYKRRAEKQIATEKRQFIARFVRCMRVAARRQALNLEPNQLKIAVADALMTEMPISRHEIYAPMDARTATFVIERGLDQPTALAFVDSLIKRSAAFMRMGDEALTQVEEDLENIQPVAPAEKGAQADPMGMPQMAQGDPMGMDPGVDPSMMGMEGQEDFGMDPAMDPNADPNAMGMQGQGDPSMGMDPGVDPAMMGMEGQDDQGAAGMPDDMQMVDPMSQAPTPDQRAAAMRRRASNGNLPINTGISQPRVASTGSSKRDQIKFAVGGTKSAGLHNFFGNR